MRGSNDSDQVDADGDFEIVYACVFCGEATDDDSDACELSVGAPSGQGFFTCHARCFRAAAHDPEHFPDLLTPAEPEPGSRPPSPELQEAWQKLEDVLGAYEMTELPLAETRALTEALRELAPRHGVRLFDDDD